MFDFAITKIIRFLIRFLSRIFSLGSGRREEETSTSDKESSDDEKEEKHALTVQMTSLNMMANAFQCFNENEKKSFRSVPMIESHPVMAQGDQVIDNDEDNPYHLYDSRSKWKAMRLKKHFTVQTSLMLKEGETSYVGAFAVSSELRTVKRSPISYLPFFSELFSRTEFMLVKSAILVFITGRSVQKGVSNSLPYPNIKSADSAEREQEEEAEVIGMRPVRV